MRMCPLASCSVEERLTARIDRTNLLSNSMNHLYRHFACAGTVIFKRLAWHSHRRDYGLFIKRVVDAKAYGNGLRKLPLPGSLVQSPSDPSVGHMLR